MEKFLFYWAGCFQFISSICTDQTWALSPGYITVQFSVSSESKAESNNEFLNSSSISTGKLDSPHSTININNRLTDFAFQRLDFENPNERKFLLVVVATEEKTERRLSSSATITVEVEDLNDNSPVFDLDSYTQTISENSVPGNSLATTVAVGWNCEIFLDYQLKIFSSSFIVPKSLGWVLISLSSGLHNNGGRIDTSPDPPDPTKPQERQIKKSSVQTACCTERCLWLQS